MADDPSGRNGPTKSNFNIDKYLANEATKVSIVSTTGVKIEAVLVSDFTFGIGSEYKSLFEIGDIDKLSDNLNMLTTAVNAASGFTKLKQIPQLRLKTPGLTTKQFAGAKDLKFSIDILLLQYVEGESLKDKIDALSTLCLPEVIGFNNIGVGVYKAPLGYAGNVLRARSAGNVAITIGKWFQAMSQIVFDVSFHMSRVASDASGTPLYVTATISFGPSIEVGLGEFKSYFLDV